MPSDDYAPIVRGGLKLKGAAAGVTKKKKKKKSKSSSSESKALETALKDRDDERRVEEQDGAVRKKEKDTREGGEDDGEEVDGQDMRELEHRDPNDGKTASERAYEETRRKRLQERLLREGPPKTHKQRVEELNKYLSNLSEHHDMPRIGPG
ncbi:uncharacterized protein BP5553_01219 [Venustampulla echinocandica]|uniref:DUF1754-domain-containing protein n=1 Tax=Venustampulla echinocandica TaxID=2656787 RepID=A0A370U0D4_9HELO|nr:uncharacterized protein BP5553_01219 [Venustampulla echinocandica]RDL41240.1 hypothetical protein BP5553_01219 [Venustampulla echinocandica]